MKPIRGPMLMRVASSAKPGAHVSVVSARLTIRPRMRKWCRWFMLGMRMPRIILTGFDGLTKVLLDSFRCEAWEIRRVAATWNSMNRMAGKGIEQCERCAVSPIESQDANFRINRTNGFHIFVTRH